MKANTLLAILVSIGASACGGGGGKSAAPVAAGNAAVAPASGVAGAPGAATQASDAPPAATTPPPATTTPTPAAPAPASASTSPTASAPAAAPVASSPVSYNFYRLGNGNNVGSATVENDTLAINGQRYTGVKLAPGQCSVSSGNLSRCSSSPALNAYSLCGVDQGSNKFSGLYVLFEPSAVQITDASVLRNLSFSGYEDCGAGNVGAQPKGAPNAKLTFDKDGNLSLTRYDADPPKTSSLPSYFVNLRSETTSGGVAARLNLYRQNGRYLLVATGVPTSGITPANPGTLLTFYQD